MKLLYVTLPLGACMAAAGVWLISTASSAAPANSPANGTEPKHPVTPVMAKDAAALAKKAAPDFTLTDSTGKPWTLASLSSGKPVFLYFILDGCPCSTDAEPLFHLLYDRYKGQITFAGVIGSDVKTAAKWKKDHQMPYTILADPELKVVHAYDAKHSVYNALISNGSIEKMWPGYSHDQLIDANAKMAEVIGTPAKPFDPLYAPLKLSSGCSFSEKS